MNNIRICTQSKSKSITNKTNLFINVKAKISQIGVKKPKNF